ncbi:MAG: GntR family transcriptional regulator [Lachnospiraceae bacterium]|nr:GntR family transcriptional regulator [Lachnospiraceae bacterium]
MILLDERDKRPIYEQMIDKLTDLMAREILTKDSPMPSVRSFAMELSINPNTVQRAYNELERMGYIYTVKGKGSFVADNEKAKKESRQSLMGELDSLCERARALGVTQEAVISEVKDNYGRAEK